MTHNEEAEMFALFRRLVTLCRGHPAPSVSNEELAAKLDTIHTELKTMSETQTQEATDVAQIAADVKTLTDGIAALKAQIATLQQTAANSAGTVPPDLQAQIDALHQLAQTVAPAVAPATPAA